MKNDNFKLNILFFTCLVFVVGGIVANYFGVYQKAITPVFADDDDDDDEESEEIKYKTVYTKLPDTIVTTTRRVPRYDSDKDGKYDDEDPHPTINEYFIVKDDNLNGIDDQYEPR